MTTMTVDRPAAGSVTGRATRPGPNFLTAPLAGRTWREQSYLALVLLLAPFAFTYAVFAVSFTASIAVTVVGLFVAGAVVLGARGWGAAYRSLARELLDVDVAAPTSYVRPRRSSPSWTCPRTPRTTAASWRCSGTSGYDDDGGIPPVAVGLSGGGLGGSPDIEPGPGPP